MVPTDCLIIQEPCVTRGISLKVLSRSLSLPAKNLSPQLMLLIPLPIRTPHLLEIEDVGIQLDAL